MSQISIPISARAEAAYSARRAKSAVHRLALALVWLAVASGAVVFSEPAPVDVLTMGLILALPVLGLVRVGPMLLAFLAAWMVAAAGAFVAAMTSHDIAASTIHSAISLYLYLAAFVFAGFVALRPSDHVRLVLGAYLIAATLGAGAGIAGYFDLLPGASELFTRFGRAAGPFKDPNVFGAFMVAPAIYALHLSIAQPATRAIPAGAAFALLAFAILLSFSRGAWMGLAIATAVYAYLSFVLAPSIRQRLRLAALAALGGMLVVAAFVLALEVPAIEQLLVERATLTQSYDEGSEGRFGGQRKAMALAAEHPFGIGALQFAGRHHPEDVHNVYVSMLLNAGWVGGIVFAVLCGLSIVLGLDHALRRTSTGPVFLVVYAAVVAHAVEGLLVDIDHWRHFYLMLGLLWGLMAAERPISMIGAQPTGLDRTGRLRGVACERAPRRGRRIVASRSATPPITPGPRRPRIVPARSPDTRLQ